VRLSYAQERIAQAEQAQADGQLRLAIEHYKQAAELDPENQQIKQKLAAVIELQNKGLAPESLIDDIISRDEVKAQEVKAAFNASINQAQQRQSEGNFAAAFDAAVPTPTADRDAASSVVARAERHRHLRTNRRHE